MLHKNPLSPILILLVENLFSVSRFRPVYSTICRCEIFPGERNSFSFSLGPLVKSTSDLVNARPRSFDDVRPDRDANTLGKPSELVKTVGREARSFGSPLRSRAWNTIRIESMGGTIRRSFQQIFFSLSSPDFSRGRD